jgi:hypothetical protein
MTKLNMNIPSSGIEATSHGNNMKILLEKSGSWASQVA